jgi:hypothetical protein
METSMRDTMEIFMLAEHGPEWNADLHKLFRRLHGALRWAGEAFDAARMLRAG